MTTDANNIQSPIWSQGTYPAGELDVKPYLPPSPSTSGSIHHHVSDRINDDSNRELIYPPQVGQERKRSPHADDLHTPPLHKLENSRTHSGPQVKGEKRGREEVTSTEDRAGKHHKRHELHTPTATQTGSRSATLRPDVHAETVSNVEGSRTLASDNTNIDPVQYWAHNDQQWPANFASMSHERSVSPKKRPSSASYTQQRKDGKVPEAYSSAYETYLREHRMDMDELAGRAHILRESQLLQEQLLHAMHNEPEHTMFPLPQFLQAWARTQNRNEARVQRDLTPILVPSPELLVLSGHNELEHLVEELDAEWTKCQTLAGPQPKPDLAIGVASSAFTEDEMAKLKNHASPDRPTAFTDHLYFPFLVCEVKCGDQGIRRADRQNMHSASVAVNAIVKLHESMGHEQMSALDGQTLVYSISHDTERVKLYGHFVYRGTFHRYPITSSVLNFSEQGWKSTHDFVREVYRVVYPAHLQRIQEALAAMPDPQTVSMTSSMSFEGGEENETQELDPSAYSSQENVGFKKPGTPSSKRKKSELALLREQLAEQQKQNSEQVAELQRQNRELIILLKELQK